MTSSPLYPFTVPLGKELVPPFVFVRGGQFPDCKKLLEEALDTKEACGSLSGRLIWIARLTGIVWCFWFFNLFLLLSCVVSFAVFWSEKIEKVPFLNADWKAVIATISCILFISLLFAQNLREFCVYSATIYQDELAILVNKRKSYKKKHHKQKKKGLSLLKSIPKLENE